MMNYYRSNCLTVYKAVETNPTFIVIASLIIVSI